MRRVPIIVVGVALTVALAAPAGAQEARTPAGRPLTIDRHHSRRGDPPGRTRGTSDDQPGEGRSHYDRPQHDDPSILF